MNVLRMVKLFGWMSFSEQQIDEKREEELVWVKKAQLLNVFTIVIGCVLFHEPCHSRSVIIPISVRKVLPTVSMLASYTI
jgi:hypothetical protein